MSDIIKKLGTKGEIIAANYLIQKGFSLICSNYHSKYGEIDIILENEQYIIFVEVKTRSNYSLARAVEAVDKNKRLRIIKTALDYILNSELNKQPRFDVIEIISGSKTKLRHLENAFDAEEYDAFF